MALETAAVAVITMVAEAALVAATESAVTELATKLASKPARVAYRTALTTAIFRLANSGATGERRALVEVLWRKDGPLQHPTVVEELAATISPTREINTTAIADIWRAAFKEPIWRSLKPDAELLVQYLREELRNTEVFRPVFDSQRLDDIAVQTELGAEALQTIEQQLDNLASMLEGQFGRLLQTFAQAPTGLTEHIRDTSLYFAEKTRNFVGRQFIFDTITRFINTHPRGYFIIRGEPGIGKTALSAQLVRTMGYLHHFNIRADGWNRADQFLNNICAQLIIRYRLPYTRLPSEATRSAKVFVELLTEAAAQLPKSEKLVIVIDGLDEAAATKDSGTNTLYLPTILPTGVYIIVTTRPVDQPLRIECEYDSFPIAQDSPQNMADIVDYLSVMVKRPGIARLLATEQMSEDEAIELFRSKSQGNFIYLRYVLHDIEEGIISSLRQQSLPEGLLAYYKNHWARMRGQDEEAWFNYKLPVVMALTVVDVPVTTEALAQLARVKQRSRVQGVLRDWQQFLTIVEMSEGPKRYRIYHASFLDFIAAQEEVQEERVSRYDARNVIIDEMIETLFGDDE